MTEEEVKAATYAAKKQMERKPDIAACGEISMRHEIEADYLAGYAEAMRWRKCSEEMPKVGDCILLYYPLNASPIYPVGSFLNRWSWCAGEVDASDDELFVDSEIDSQAINTRCYWRPIGQLPTTDCKSEVGA